MKNKLLAEKIALSSAGVSGTLFKAEKQAERDGIEMGVLENGMPYLSEAGLARLCGVARSTLQGRVASWKEKTSSSANEEISQILKNRGFTGDELFI